MKPFKQFFIEHIIETIEPLEESEAASTVTQGVASPDSPKLGRSRFMNHDVVDIDDESFHRFVKGKVPFKRWSNYIEDETSRNELKQMYQKKKRLLVKNTKTGDMVFVK